MPIFRFLAEKKKQTWWHKHAKIKIEDANDQRSDQYFRSSHQRCSMKKGAPRNFSKFRGKHLCQNLFFNKVAGLRPAETLVQLFACEFCEIFWNTFFTEHLCSTASVRVLVIYFLVISMRRAQKLRALGKHEFILF